MCSALGLGWKLEQACAIIHTRNQNAMACQVGGLQAAREEGQACQQQQHGAMWHRELPVVYYGATGLLG